MYTSNLKKKTAERSQKPYSSQPKLGNYSSSHLLQQSHCRIQSNKSGPTTATTEYGLIKLKEPEESDGIKMMTSVCLHTYTVSHTT